MLFHHHCEVCGAEACHDVTLRVLYVGFCGGVVTKHYLCGYHSRELEKAMYRMKDKPHSR